MFNPKGVYPETASVSLVGELLHPSSSANTAPFGTDGYRAQNRDLPGSKPANSGVGRDGFSAQDGHCVPSYYRDLDNLSSVPCRLNRIARSHAPCEMPY